MSPLWGGRFAGDTDPLMARFNASLPYDWRLWEADISGSVAWANAIARAGLLSDEERAQIVSGLAAVRAEIAIDPAAAFVGATDEDIHSYIERRLTECIGPTAGKLHAGRSRNDQVATDLRLWLKWEITGIRRTRLDADEVDEWKRRPHVTGHAAPRSAVTSELSASIRRLPAALDTALVSLIRAATDRAEAEIEVLMPGYTHVQPAQPVRWSHWLLSHAWAWQRDRERLINLLARVDVLPLGAGALAGCPFPVDRSVLAIDLGFTAASPNSIDAVSDRDFVAEFLFWAALTGVHLSRWAEDLVLWSSREFGFVTLSDAFSTGSSLMPQKKNPDALELLRGKAGRLIGSLMGILALLKGLPSAYDKDLQEDKEPLFDAVDTLQLALPVAQGVLETLTLRPERMTAALGDELLATDLADALVRAGVPFRQSHHLVGQAVRKAEERGCALRDLPLAALQAISAAFTAEMISVWDFERSVEQRSVTGGTGRAAVLAQIARLRDLYG